MEESAVNDQHRANEANDDSSEHSTKIIRIRKKRKRDEDCEDNDDIILPDNCLEVERNLHASAIKNNLSEKHVKNIIKKVVTNDHVLALVQLQEEEESAAMKQEAKRPKLTRSKVKELMKASPQITTWNVELTPINQIPVKTRPEVTALIAQELPDESDEEYQPTHDEVSDDDQDSQPRTPATPSSTTQSPQVVTDGPFKVPQEINTPVRRKLDLDEPTIALRTRSKLSLSETPIEHIESSFVPPDELPHPDVDDLWNQFLSECLDPAPNTKNEEDDEADPEYNADNDPDAKDEDEEALESNLVKISKKELNDLVTELFHILPEGSIEELAQKEINNSSDVQSLFGKGQRGLGDSGKGKYGEVYSEGKGKNCEVYNEGNEVFIEGKWKGKQEVDEEKLTINTNNNRRVSIGKSEMSDEDWDPTKDQKSNAVKRKPRTKIIEKGSKKILKNSKSKKNARNIEMDLDLPPALRDTLERTYQEQQGPDLVEINLPTDNIVILPEQIQILEQQLRQHIQLSTSNFLQLYIHPIHWQYAPKYKEYLESFYTTAKENPNSVVKVCNLEPAVQLIHSWEATVSEDTPANKEIVEHIEKENEKYRRRLGSINVLGSFHPTIMNVVATSPVFLYPHLLPPMPFRPDPVRRYEYFQSEDAYLATGLHEFSEYIKDNPKLFPRTSDRWSLSEPLSLVRTHMLPWIPWRALTTHVFNVRKYRPPENPLYKFLVTHKLPPVKHKLLPFNPNMTLYQQPEHEIPLVWLRYIGKKNRRIKNYASRRKRIGGIAPQGIPVDYQKPVEDLTKQPLPFNYLGKTKRHQLAERPKSPTIIQTINTDNDTGKSTHNITITNQSEPPKIQNNNCIYRLVQTPTGAILMPIIVQDTPPDQLNEQTLIEIDKKLDPPKQNQLAQSKKSIKNIGDEFFGDHCTCCEIIRRICKEKQPTMKDYFYTIRGKQKVCPCKRRSYPKMSNKLKILVDNFQAKIQSVWRGMHQDIMDLEKKLKQHDELTEEEISISKARHIDLNDSDYIHDLAFAMRFQIKLWTRVNMLQKSFNIKRRFHNLFSSFCVGFDDPIFLAREVEKTCKEELLDIYREFLMFFTEAQVETMKKYREYFVTVHLDPLLKKIKEVVTDVKPRLDILNCISNTLTDKDVSGCYLCSRVLPRLSAYPQLANYFFSLFPHRHKDWKCPVANIDITSPDIITRSDDDQTLLSETVETDEGIEINITKSDGSLLQNGLPNIQIEDTAIVPRDSMPHIETESEPIQIKRPVKKRKKKTITGKKQNHVNSDLVQNIVSANIEDNIENTQLLNNIGTAHLLNNIRTAQLLDNAVFAQNEIGTVDIVNNVIPAETQIAINVRSANAQDQPMSLLPIDANVVNNSSIVLKFEAGQNSSDEDAPLILPKKKTTKKYQQKETLNDPQEHLMEIKRSPSEEDIFNMSEEESVSNEKELNIKCENVEEEHNIQWSREEDKQLLELLKITFFKAKQTNKSIPEILKVKNHKVLKEKIPNKSINCIKTRINYLTKFLMNQEMA